MRRSLMFSSIAALCAFMPAAVLAHDHVAFDFRFGTNNGYYEDGDQRAAWIAHERREAHERWEQRQRWEAQRRWQEEEARRQYWENERRGHHEWRQDDDD